MSPETFFLGPPCKVGSKLKLNSWDVNLGSSLTIPPISKLTGVTFAEDKLSIEYFSRGFGTILMIAFELLIKFQAVFPNQPMRIKTRAVRMYSDKFWTLAIL